jgi:Nif-specific regulatory protein
MPSEHPAHDRSSPPGPSASRPAGPHAASADKSAAAPRDAAVPPAALSNAALASIIESVAAINASLDLSPTLMAIARSAAEVLGADASSVLLLDPVRDKLTFVAAVGDRAPLLIGESFDAKLGIAGRVASTGTAMLVTDVRESPDFFRGIDDKSSYRTESMVAAPMRRDNAVIGVIEVLNKRGGQSFTPDDVTILDFFANLAALSVSKAQAHEAVKRENRALRATSAPAEMIGRSPALANVLALVQRVAPTNATVLLLGETGTGKELTARAVHAGSQRAKRPFIAINCAALPESLLESELFGHEAGAFTGATSQKLGRFELADGGTLFLDEIGDITPVTQIKLLRVLQEREFVRVGGSQTVSCDVRIIAATNRNLTQAIQAGLFREDLYYRLNVFPIELPPLRERREDIPLLVEHFCQATARHLGVRAPAVSPEAMEALRQYRWPGNIRELRNVLERAVLLCDGPQLEITHLPREISNPAAGAAFGAIPPGFAAAPDCSGNAPATPAERRSVLADQERAAVEQALRANDWNQTRAARALGISRDNLRYRMKKFGLERPDRA